LWAQNKETQQQRAAIERTLESTSLALRGTVAKYRYLPYAVAQHPDVVAALLDPANTTKNQRANAYLQAMNWRAGSEALYVMNTAGTTLAASNWDRRNVCQ
jgi:C4-dicarboxylate-specific signal transduction histidine kinase